MGCGDESHSCQRALADLCGAGPGQGFSVLDFSSSAEGIEDCEECATEITGLPSYGQGKCLSPEVQLKSQTIGPPAR